MLYIMLRTIQNICSETCTIFLLFSIYLDKKYIDFLRNNNICHLLKISRDNFRHPAYIFRNEINTYLLFFINIFEKCSTSLLSLSFISQKKMT